MLIIGTKIYTKSQNSVKILYKANAWWFFLQGGGSTSVVRDYTKKSGHEKRKRKQTLLLMEIDALKIISQAV